jgi:hypothetical protein
VIDCLTVAIGLALSSRRLVATATMIVSLAHSISADNMTCRQHDLLAMVQANSGPVDRQR